MRRPPRSALFASPTLFRSSVLLARFGSSSAGVAVAELSNAPAALIVAVTLMVVLAPEASGGIVHRRAGQPLTLTFVMVRFVGESGTLMLVAAAGPRLAPSG